MTMTETPSWAYEAQREYEDRFAPMATPGDAHREWHLNSGVPMGQPGCPQDACHPPEPDRCSGCGEYDDGANSCSCPPAAQPTVKCGNKAAHGGQPGYHHTAAGVRECYASTGRFTAASSRPAQPVEGATIKGLDWTVPPVPSYDPLSAVRAAQERKAAEEAEAKRARYAAWRSIPVYAGGRAYYALEMGGVVHFFKVSRPKKGPHAGKTFVEEQAGDAFHKMGWVRTGEVLDAIAADPDTAGRLYGLKIEKCYRCHKTLTDTDSRERGMGPDCAKKG